MSDVAASIQQLSQKIWEVDTGVQTKLGDLFKSFFDVSMLIQNDNAQLTSQMSSLKQELETKCKRMDNELGHMEESVHDVESRM